MVTFLISTPLDRRLGHESQVRKAQAYVNISTTHKRRPYNAIHFELDENTVALHWQVKPECQERLYSVPACILHGPGPGKQILWNITASLNELRRNTSPWVDIL
jgi:hypothetical protein